MIKSDAKFMAPWAALFLVTVSASAGARSETSYHLLSRHPALGDCVREEYGATFNTCGVSKNDVIFDIAIDSVGLKTITATVDGPGNASTTCTTFAFLPNGSHAVGETKTFNPTGQQTQSLGIVAFEGNAVRLNCALGNGRKIGVLYWNP